MKTLLAPCISTILRKGGTFEDLQRFMLDDMNKDLIAEGLRSPSPGHRNFFKLFFRSDTYKETKKSIFTRIQSLLNTDVFYNSTIGKTSINFREALDNKKVIIFNLSKGKIGTEASSSFGRFIIAHLFSIAIQRANIPEDERVPVHLFIDECQLYITKSIEQILSESRKYKVHATLAQQILGQEMSPQLKKIVMGNTSIKLTGKNANYTLKEIASTTGSKVDDMMMLGNGLFSCKFGDAKPFNVRVPAHLLNGKNAMPESAYNALLERNKARNYRKLEFLIDENGDIDSTPPLKGSEPDIDKPKYTE